MTALQNWMIFPGHATQGHRSTVVRPNGDVELLTLKTRDGEHVAAVFGRALASDGRPHAEPSAQPTVVWFYGNAMCMAECAGVMRSLRRLGCNVLVPEYVGYGMSGGEPGEQACYATADAAYDHLTSRGDVDPSRIVPAGWSLGAAVAIDLAWRRPSRAVMGFSAFTDMAELARRLMPLVPTALLEHRFESARKLAAMDVPVFLGHGRWDSIVPHDMSAALARAARGKVTRLTVEADHNDLFEAGGEELWGAVGAFLRDLDGAAV